jgi:hypothetical protein
VNNDDSRSPLRCPHPAFLEHSILAHVRQLLADRFGLFLINFATRDPTLPVRNQFRHDLLANFKHLASIKLEDDINEIMLASEQTLDKLKTTRFNANEKPMKHFDSHELLAKLSIEN